MNFVKNLWQELVPTWFQKNYLIRKDQLILKTWIPIFWLYFLLQLLAGDFETNTALNYGRRGVNGNSLETQENLGVFEMLADRKHVKKESLNYRGVGVGQL